MENIKEFIERHCVFSDSAHPFGFVFHCNNCDFEIELEGLNAYYETHSGEKSFFLHPPHPSDEEIFRELGVRGYAYTFLCSSCGCVKDIFFCFEEGSIKDPTLLYPEQPLWSLETVTCYRARCECEDFLLSPFDVMDKVDKGEKILCPHCKRGYLEHLESWIA